MKIYQVKVEASKVHLIKKLRDYLLIRHLREIRHSLQYKIFQFITNFSEDSFNFCEILHKEELFKDHQRERSIKYRNNGFDMLFYSYSQYHLEINFRLIGTEISGVLIELHHLPEKYHHLFSFLFKYAVKAYTLSDDEGYRGSITWDISKPSSINIEKFKRKLDDCISN